jgi:hypothetical protein
MEGRIRERKLLAETVVREIRNQVRAGKQPDRSELQTMSELVAVYLPQFVEKLRQLYPSISDDNILFCILTRLHFTPKEIAVALGISQQVVSNRRKRLNLCLFKKTAGTMRFAYNIHHLA